MVPVCTFGGGFLPSAKFSNAWSFSSKLESYQLQLKAMSIPVQRLPAIRPTQPEKLSRVNPSRFCRSLCFSNLETLFLCCKASQAVFGFLLLFNHALPSRFF